MRITAASLALGLVLALPVPAAAAGLPDGTFADATDPAVTSLAKDYGLTIAEARRRIGWQEPATRMAEQLAKSTGQFGGVWLDPADGGRVKIGWVGTDLATARSIVEGYGLGTATDFVPVRYSAAQLEQDAAWLGGALRSANAAGVQLSSATQPDRNRTVLRVPAIGSLSAAQQDVVTAARARLGSRLVVESSMDTGIDYQACLWLAGDFDCDAPLRGGSRLYINTSQPQCTTAFNARSNSDNKWYMMTAGHCGAIGTVFTAYQPGTGNFHTVGAVHNRSAGANDYSIVTINNVAGWNPRNWVYVHASGDTVLDPDYTITNTATSPVGTRVCISGSTSGTDCGDVVEINWNGSGGFARAQYCSDGGDSGGAVYSGHNARGIHIGVVAGHDGDCLNALFQGITEAANNLNVHVYTG